MSVFLKWILGSSLLGVGSLASLWGLAGRMSSSSPSSGGGGGGYAQVPELSLGTAGLAATVLAGTAVLLSERRRKAKRA